ncbi:acyltransferase family protein [Brachybacterium sp.]|uniref:acyltransferase family protein n=1 Tax=Brachybacterium sp. TaxID=1891286 RepID=UPI003F93A225
MTAVAAAPQDPGSGRRSSFRPDVQGLRAIAVGLVVLFHAGVEQLSGGFVGVDVFFVISGFLITTHLLESLAAHGRISFGRFYAKRARRILPASLLVALLTVLAAWAWMPPLLMSEVFRSAVATALYVPNLHFAVEGTNYLAETSPSVFQHYWSLGIEEQFYLFWPAILALGFWLCRRSERRLFAVAAVLTLASFFGCVLWMDVSQPWTFFSLPTRAWELGAGALTAFLLRTGLGWLRHPATGLLAWLGLASLMAIAVLYDSSTPFPGYAAALPVIATVLLLVGGAAPGSWHAGRLLSLPAFQLVGAISYSLYLVHWPLQVIPQIAVGQDDPLPLWARLLLGAVAVPLAWLLYRFVERPVIAWPVLRERTQLLTGAVAVAASAVLIATAAGVQWGTAQQEASTERIAAGPEELPTEPAGTAFVPANLEPSLEEAGEDNPEIYENGCHRPQSSTDAGGCRIGENPEAPLVFLFGDSHAASWYPALAELAAEGTIRLDTNTKSSCSSAAVPLVLEGVDYVECDQWRDGVLERIDQEQPDLVLLANYGAAEQELEGGNEDYVARWQEGLASTIGSIEGPEVAVIADVPEQGETAAVCLSAHLDDARECAAPRATAFDPELVRAEQEAAEATGARYVDLTEHLCNAETCPTIIGNVLVYRDGHHLTATFSTLMARPLWEEIRVMLD